MAKKAPVWYGIRKGRGAPAMVATWAEVVAKTKGFSGAEFRKFKSPAEVKAYLADAGSDAVEVFGRESSTTEGAHAVPPGSLALWFDGGSRRNPGPSGAGAVIFSEENVELYSAYKYVGDRTTNNEAEYEGMILGLEAAVKIGRERVVVKGDSMLVIQQMMGRWRVSAPNLVGLHRKATDILRTSGLKCTWEHVPRKLNARADALANMAMDTKKDGFFVHPSVDTKPSSSSTANACPPEIAPPPASTFFDLTELDSVSVPAQNRTTSSMVNSTSTDPSCADPLRSADGGSFRDSSSPLLSSGDGRNGLTKRRFQVCLALWRTADLEAAAAVLYKLDSTGRHEALLRVARCRRASRKAPPVMTGGARGRGMGRDKKSVQPAAAVVNALQVFGEALEEIVVHGGGEVEAVTNEPKLSDILKSHSFIHPGGGTNTACLAGSLFSTDTTVIRVRSRWKALRGVHKDTSDTSELSSAIMLARCTADPSSVLVSAGASSQGGVDNTGNMRRDTKGASYSRTKYDNSASAHKRKWREV